MASLLKLATKLTIVGGATVLVVNHEVFGANKYTKQIISEIRKSLPDTAEAFDQMPNKEEFSKAAVDGWNGCVQASFKWLSDAPAHTRQLYTSVSDKIRG